MSFEDRMESLRKFVTDAKDEDWYMMVAGQRVQIIKQDDYEGGRLQFGTEVVSNPNGTITCLLGASPGASTAAQIMLQVLDKAFPEITNSEEGLARLQEIVPMWKREVTKELFTQCVNESKSVLGV